MPSLQKTKSKRQKSSGRGASAKYLWQIQIDLGDRRTTLRLGLLSEAAAAEISRQVDHLIECRQHGIDIREETKAWLLVADEKLVTKLAGYGLCNETNNPTIVAYVAKFLDRKALTAADGTIVNYRQVEKLIQEFFPLKRMSEVTTADAKAFWTFLMKDKDCAENTARRRFGRAREIFNDALEQDVVLKNVFKLKSIPVSVGVGDKTYVPASTIQAVIKHLPADKVEWKLLFAMARFLGVRMPSEIRNMTWEDVNQANGTILIRAQKTKSQRLVPLPEEVSSLLSLQHLVVPDGTIHVFPALRHHTNTATTATRFVEQAGFASWKKFWNSLRASCETDMMDRYGLRKACMWIGNSPTIAMKHYSLMRKTDYIDGGETAQVTSPKSDAKSDAEQVRNDENSEEQKRKNPEKPMVSRVQKASSDPYGNRTHVAAVKGRCPRPLDEGAVWLR
jgi:integrase